MKNIQRGKFKQVGKFIRYDCPICGKPHSVPHYPSAGDTLTCESRRESITVVEDRVKQGRGIEYTRAEDKYLFENYGKKSNTDLANDLNSRFHGGVHERNKGSVQNRRTVLKKLGYELPQKEKSAMSLFFKKDSRVWSEATLKDVTTLKNRGKKWREIAKFYNTDPETIRAAWRRFREKFK